MYNNLWPIFNVNARFRCLVLLVDCKRKQQQQQNVLWSNLNLKIYDSIRKKCVNGGKNGQTWIWICDWIKRSWRRDGKKCKKLRLTVTARTGGGKRATEYFWKSTDLYRDEGKHRRSEWAYVGYICCASACTTKWNTFTASFKWDRFSNSIFVFNDGDIEILSMLQYPPWLLLAGIDVGAAATADSLWLM